VRGVLLGRSNREGGKGAAGGLGCLGWRCSWVAVLAEHAEGGNWERNARVELGADRWAGGTRPRGRCDAGLRA